MNDRQLDDLLERRLNAPAEPGDEAPELDELARTAAILRAARAQAADEASASMPVARARFERFLAASATPATPRSRERRRWTFGLPRPLALVSAAGVAVVVLALAVIVGSNLGSVETASALSPGDYVQIEGVVSGTTPSGATNSVTLTSEVDEQALTITLDEATSLLDGASGTPLRPGDAVLVGGVVGNDRVVTASTVVRSAAANGKPQPVKLKQLSGTLSGRIVSFALAADGKTARLVLDDGKGNHYLVPITARAAETLLGNAATAVGLRVTVSRSDGPGKPFSVEVSRDQPAGGPGPAPAGFSGVTGVIVGRDLNVLRVETGRGMLNVVIRPATRILLGQSGLILEEVVQGKASAVGHMVSVSGALDPTGRRLVADVLVIGPRAPSK